MDSLRLIGTGGLRLNYQTNHFQVFARELVWFGGLRLNENQTQNGTSSESQHDVAIHVAIPFGTDIPGVYRDTMS
jgi:hypothetical protein